MTQPDTTTDRADERRAALLRLAERQGVKPISNIDDLRGDFWKDEGSEDFDEWLRRTRAEGDRRQAG